MTGPRQFQEFYVPEVTPAAEQDSSALEAHIYSGLTMIKDGRGEEAFSHFITDSPDVPDISVERGGLVNIPSLLTEEDVVMAASEVARHSQGGRSIATIGDWLLNGKLFAKMSDRPDLYVPPFSDMFWQEVAIVAAEEWLHILQKRSGGVLTLDGYNDDIEVDIAATLDATGIQMSADFLTRYPYRARWCTDKYPERRDELVVFGRKYSRPVEHIAEN